MKPSFRDVQQGGLFFGGIETKGLIIGRERIQTCFCGLVFFCGGERKKSWFDVGFEEIPSIFV